jgi:hypothetical protein
MAAVLFLFAPVACEADEPYREWLDFFEGKWNTDWDEPFTFCHTDGKYAVYGEITAPDGTKALATFSRDAGSKALVFTWMDSEGAYVRQVFTVFEVNRMSGLVHRSGPDGASTGSSMVERLGPDKYTVTLKIINPSGNLLETSGEMTRIK